MLRYCLALFTLLTACQAPESPLLKSTETHFASLNRHDLQALKDDYADEATGEAPNWGKVVHGSDSIIYQYGRLFLSTPDLKFEITKTTGARDHVVLEYTMSGTFTNPQEGTPEFMKGKKYAFPACTLLEFTNGKIIREANYFDQVVFLRQMGYFDQR